ncbi:hypothetical protein [Dolichospermum sp. UHCC 0259]|nr:hypothetical protein [Dolichospermum sp. UHCC 0259]
MELKVFSLEDLLTQSQTQECSDLHLSIGKVPYLRIKGRLESSQYPIIE